MVIEDSARPGGEILAWGGTPWPIDTVGGRAKVEADLGGLWESVVARTGSTQWLCGHVRSEASGWGRKESWLDCRDRSRREEFADAPASR